MFLMGECIIFSGFQKGEICFISRSASMKRNILISYMENHMVDGLNNLLLCGLGIIMSNLVETLSSVEEGVGYTSSIGDLFGTLGSSLVSNFSAGAST